jgi:hypothetical protein
MTKPESKAWHDAIDRVVERTARDISRAFERMEATLPEGVAGQMAARQSPCAIAVRLQSRIRGGPAIFSADR